MPAGPEQLFTVGSEAGFSRWVDGFRARAQARGIRANVLAAAFADVAYDPSVIEKDRNQAELVKPIWEYVDKTE